VFNWVWSFKCDKETEQAAVLEWYCNTNKEWFLEAVQKFPKAAMYNLGSEYIELAVVSIQPKGDKIAANDLGPSDF
jgi:hypothetical protein